MKKRYFAYLILLGGVVLLAVIHKKSQSSEPSTLVDAQNQPASQQQSSRQVTPKNVVPSPVAPAPANSQTSSTVIIEGVPVSKEVLRYAENVKADPLYDWKQPINFYGKVVDENNQPVVSANVDYTWSTLAPKGTLTKHDEADDSGLFSIHETGKGVGITVSKEGYYTTPNERFRNYEYANPGDGLFTPDPNNPVVFHLRKKGIGVNLITSQYGMSPDFPIQIPRDGTPVKLDIMQRRVGDSGQIQISENKPESGAWQQAKSWSFRMEIPDGGFVEENEAFPFEAPENGYQPVTQFEFQHGQTNWATALKKDFYIKFGSPPRYGHVQVQTDISYGGAIITYSINPTGSRNLEPK